MRLFNGKSQRMIACICVVSMLLACFSGSMTAFAQGTPVLSASSHTVEKDDTVSVAVTLNGNTGVWALKVKVGYLKKRPIFKKQKGLSKIGKSFLMEKNNEKAFVDFLYAFTA